MFSDAVSKRVDSAVIYSNGNGCHVFEPWESWHPSTISHHGKTCCEIAREWIADTDFALLNGGNRLTGPRWLRQRFDWGPGIYPIFWCEVLKKKKLDCGVHAALAQEVFTRRGIRSYRAQLVQQFSAEASATWHSSWTNDKAITDWIRDDRIYHEGCAVEIDEGQLKLWDSSAGCWMDPKTVSGYGAVLAVRIAAREHHRNLVWGPHQILVNRWVALKPMAT